MRVKKMEWGKRGTFWEGKVQDKRFPIIQSEEGFSVLSETGNCGFPVDTLEKAQAVAQHHFEEYVRGFCEPDALDSQIEALIKENLGLKGLLEVAKAQFLERTREKLELKELLAEAEEKIEELKTWM